MPICNHTECVSKDNIGYCQGIFEDGTPFEAEHYKAGKEEGLALIMPLLHDLEDKLPPQDLSYSLQYLNSGSANTKDTTESSKVKYLKGQSEYTDNSVLWIGMAFNGMEEDIEVLQDYVGYLKDNEVIRFTSPLENCAIFYCTDVAGHDFAKLNITLKEESGAVIAETSLKFTPFRNNRSNLFSIVK